MFRVESETDFGLQTGNVDSLPGVCAGGGHPGKNTVTRLLPFQVLLIWRAANETHQT
jgi:hypothetical protein